MTLAEAISATRERIIKDPTAEFPFLEEMQQSAEAREIATRNALTATMMPGDPVTPYMAAIAMGIQIGVTWGKAQAETESLERMLDDNDRRGE